MKLKTNNKFSKWLFKLACKLGYSPYAPPELKVINVNPEDFIKLQYRKKVSNTLYKDLSEESLKSYIDREIYNELLKKLIPHIKIKSWFNFEDYTTTFYAELYILNKEKLEDFYGKY